MLHIRWCNKFKESGYNSKEEGQKKYHAARVGLAIRNLHQMQITEVINGEPRGIKPCHAAPGVLLRVTGRTLGDQTFPSSGDRYRDG
jgi:hypothetical protein